MSSRGPILALTPILAALAGCYTPPPEGLRAGGKRENVVPTIGDPIPITGSQSLAFPFAVRVNDEGQQKFGIGSGSIGSSVYDYGGSYSENPTFSRPQGSLAWMGSSGLHWNNVILLDRKTGKSQLVFDRKVVIAAAYFPGEKGSWEQGMFFALAEADTNGDKYINEQDAVVLYHCALTGPKLTPVTPTSGSQFRSLQALNDDGTSLCVRTRKDTNGDGAFTAADETVLLRVDVSGGKSFEGTPMLPTELLKQAFDVVSPSK
jgi:hypothetical protein